MWKSVVDGQRLHFHLAGINNQNFIMQDEETGSWWQQVSGEAIQGPLKGLRLEPVYWDEVSFAIWKREHPNTRVLLPDENYESRYLSSDWDERMGELATVVSVDPEDGLEARTLVVGVAVEGRAKAYPIDAVVAQNPIVDQIGSTAVVLIVDTDGRSVRCFDRTVDGQRLDLFLKSPPILPMAAAEDTGAVESAGASGEESADASGDEDADAIRDEHADPSGDEAADASGDEDADDPPAPPTHPIVLIDAQTGSEWDFSGTAISGPLAGKKLRPIQSLKDYWFDWKLYNPDTGIYTAGILTPKQ